VSKFDEERNSKRGKRNKQEMRSLLGHFIKSGQRSRRQKGESSDATQREVEGVGERERARSKREEEVV